MVTVAMVVAKAMGISSVGCKALCCPQTLRYLQEGRLKLRPPPPACRQQL